MKKSSRSDHKWHDGTNDPVRIHEMFHICHDPVEPEKSLLAAILHRAFNDMMLPNRKNSEFRMGGKGARLDALRWIFHTKLDSSIPFSFAWVCDHLKLDPFWLRENAQQLFEQTLGGTTVGADRIPAPSRLRRVVPVSRRQRRKILRYIRNP